RAGRSGGAGLPARARDGPVPRGPPAAADPAGAVPSRASQGVGGGPMSRPRVTVFVCTGKDCSRAWGRACDGSPGKWLKREVEAAGLPYKLTVVKAECMDHCEQAGCLCFVHDSHAALETGVRSPHDADRLLAALRSCVESDGRPVTPG